MIYMINSTPISNSAVLILHSAPILCMDACVCSMKKIGKKRDMPRSFVFIINGIKMLS